MVKLLREVHKQMFQGLEANFLKILHVLVRLFCSTESWFQNNSIFKLQVTSSLRNLFL